MSAKRFVIFLLFLCLVFLAIPACIVAALDPFFHYHKPRDGYVYVLDNERAQNDGIIRHFDYDAVITGTSVAENFKTSECDQLFDANTIKICFAGATFQEIDDNLKKALGRGNINYVFRSMDDTYLIKEKDAKRLDLGEYPTYLYNDILYDDVNYLLNRDVFFGYCVPMLQKKIAGEEGSITSFDEYANWMGGFTFGYEEMTGGRHGFQNNVRQRSMTKEEIETERENIEANVLQTIRAYPDTTHYLFFSPYSVVWWGELYNEGNALKQIEAQALAIEMLCGVENIKLYSFHHDLAITANAENYRDAGHYGEWINSLMLKAFYEDDKKYRITTDNAKDYIAKMKEIYLNYDYNALVP